MQWYYSKNGTQLGPVTGDELRDKLASGEIFQTDLIWKEGMADWLPVSRVPEFSPSSLSDEGLPGQLPPPPQGYPAGPYMGPVTSGKATASMVLGIVGLVFGLCGCYGLVISVPCCILAIVFGGQVKAEAARNPGLAGELGKVKGGIIMGWIGLGISILVTAGLIFIGMAAGFANGINQP